MRSPSTAGLECRAPSVGFRHLYESVARARGLLALAVVRVPSFCERGSRCAQEPWTSRAVCVDAAQSGGLGCRGAGRTGLRFVHSTPVVRCQCATLV